jgi:formiminoglutamate deiminase
MRQSGAWHAEQAWLGRRAENVLIAVEDGVIKAVTENTSAPRDAVELKGWTLPGLANVHSHAFQRKLRGRVESGGGDFWKWRELMYRATEWDEEGYRDFCASVFGDMLTAGITAVGEFHYLHAGGNTLGRAVIAAARKTGIRLTLVDACYLFGGVDGRPLAGAQRTFSDGDVDRWAERMDELADEVREGEGIRIGAAIHSVRAVDPDSMRVVAAWARRGGAPLHVHLAEQPAEVEECRTEHGCTPAELLEREGILGEDLTAVHAIHVQESDMSLLGAHRVSVCACTTSERDLGDRVGPLRALADAGCPLTVGSDSNSVIDMLEEARGLELDQRRATGRRALHQPEELLQAATSSGMRALGWKGGELKVGMVADFITVRPPAESAALDAAQVVFARAACDVTNVVVGGRTVVST